ncbi:MAG: HAMP domain-containing protein [Actinobacteria bacterium]|nr:HAMP domain-containing protein [Actinomycetota bacterium]
MKISRKLLIAFLLISLVPLLATSLISYYVLRVNIENDITSQLEAVAEVQHTRLETIIDRDYERLALITSRTQLRQSLAGYNQNHDPESQAKMTAILNDAAASTDVLENITVLDMKGRVAASTDPSLAGNDESDSEGYKAGMSGEETISLSRSEDGTLMQNLSGPLVLDGQTIGAARIESEAADLLSMVSDYTGLGKTGETLLGQRDERGDAQFIHPLRFDKDAALSLTIEKERLDVPMNRALSGESVVTTDSIDYRGKQIIAATRFIEDTGWGLVVKQDTAEAFSAVGTLRNIIGLLFILTSILVVAVSIFVSGTITKPVSNLTEIAEEISAGDLSKKADENVSGEIGTLGRAFNRMTGRLVEARETLEERVMERTEELEVTSQSLAEEIEERRQYEEALEQSEDRYRDLFENASDLI